MNTTTTRLSTLLLPAILLVALAAGDGLLRPTERPLALAPSKKEMKMALTMSHFYEMRLTGNPDVNVQERLWNAAIAIAADPTRSFSKPGMASGSVWTELGPWNIGGRIRAIANSPAEPDVLYAGAASGGVWKSTNLGQTWKPLTDFLPSLGVGAIALDPSNPNTVLAGVGEPIDQADRINASFMVSRSAGILRSDDAGATWRLIPWSSSSMKGVHRIAVHPVSVDTMLVATLSDLWKSTDGGSSWVRAYSGTITDVVYKPGQPSRVYIAVGQNSGGFKNGVYVSDAGGASGSWRRFATNFPAVDSCGRIVIGVTPADPNRIYAAVALNRNKMASYNTDFNVLMVSTNGGDTWQRKLNAISRSFTNGQAWYDFVIGVSPTDANVVFLGGLDIYRSTNGGGNFSKKSSNVHVDVHSIIFKSGEPQTVIAGSDGGVFVSTTLGTSWTTRYYTLGTIQYYSCAFDPLHPTWYFGGTQDNGTHQRTEELKDRWVSIFGGDGAHVAADPTNDQYRYVVSSYGSGDGTITRPVIRMGPEGAAQLTDGMGEGDAADRFVWVPVVKFHPTNKSTMFTSTQFMYRMKNPTGKAARWTAISPDLAPGNGIITDFAVPVANEDWMYTCSSNGRVYLSQNVLSADPLWTAIGTGLPSRWIANIAADWDDYQTAYVAVSGFGGGHAFKTTNAGASWVNITGDLPDIPAGAIVRSRQDANTLFLATDLGVWITTNGGTNWQRYGDNFPNVVAYDMKLTTDDMLLVGTHGRGMWRASSVLSADAPGSGGAGDFTLAQNYPNPVSSSTLITFTLPRRATVELALYAIDGRRLRTLAEGLRDAGDHTLRLATDGLQPGVYFYTLSVGQQKLTRKLSVVR